MKYKEPQTLLNVRSIKERLQQKMEAEGVDAFFDRINLRAGKLALTVKPKPPKKRR